MHGVYAWMGRQGDTALGVGAKRLATPALTLRASVLRFIHLCPPWRQLAPVLLDKVRKNDGGVARAPPRSPGAETPQPDPMTKHALSMERLMGALRDSIVRVRSHPSPNTDCRTAMAGSSQCPVGLGPVAGILTVGWSCHRCLQFHYRPAHRALAI